MPKEHHHHSEHRSESEKSETHHSKYAPTITQIIQTAAKLPHPMKAKEPTFETFVVGDSTHSITFDIVKIVDREGTKVQKWTYKGRIIIDSKYHKSISKSDD